jgi:hypothetical protein
MRALRYRGGDFFEGFMFGRDGHIQYAVCALDAPTENAAVRWSTAMLAHALPGVRVVSVERGRRHSHVDIQ